jgi:long-chain acyl-CoA synthetase
VITLQIIGVGPYGKIGIIANNRWEWATIAAAAYSLKAALVPMYEAQLASDWTYIVNDSACSVLFCATNDIYKRVQKEVLPSTPLVHSTLCLDAAVGEPHAFSTYMAAQDGAIGDATHIKAPTPEDLANLIYTSGTTGKPKGVELTHTNFTSNVKGAARSMVVNPRDLVKESDRSLAFLPWAHSYGQTCELWMAISHGAGMGICRGVPFILEDLQMVKPSVLFAVPTLYKKIFDGVHNLMDAAPPLRKKLMRRALQLGHENVKVKHGERGSLGWMQQLQFKALDSIVLSKIRARFGGNLRHGFVAGAACPAEVLEFMDSIGIPVCEGYGLTETSPIITINTPEQRKVGSVGRAIGGVKVYIVDEEGRPLPTGEEGEICCVGPNVMKGYYRNQEATEEVISTAPDGKSRM